MSVDEIINTESRSRRAVQVIVLICILLSVQISVRCWLMVHSAAIAQDGTFYLPVARHFPPDPGKSKKSSVAHPGYPVAVRAMHYLMTGDNSPAGLEQWESAGIYVALLGSVVAILGVFCFTRLIFGSWWIAFWAAMLLGLGKKFAALGADVLTDSLVLAFEIWAFVFAILAWRKLRNRRWGAVVFSALSGVLAVGAYMVKPEGLVVLPIACLLWLVGQIRHRLRWRQTVLSIAAACIVAVLLMMPYMLKVGGVTPKWKLKEFLSSAGVESQPEFVSYSGLAVIGAGAFMPVKFLGKFSEAQHPALAGLTGAFIVLWLIGKFGKAESVRKNLPRLRGAGGLLIILTWLVIIPPVILRYLSTGAMSHRYLILPAVIMAGFAPAGLLCMVRMVCDRISQKRKLLLSPKAACSIICLIISGLLIFHTLSPLHENQAFAKEAGLWVRSNSSPDQTVYMDDPIAYHYSDRAGIMVSESFLTGYVKRYPDMDRASIIRKFLKSMSCSYFAFMGPPDAPWASENAQVIKEEGFVCVNSFPKMREGKSKAKIALHVYREKIPQN